jgi:hypothetical protein
MFGALALLGLAACGDDEAPSTEPEPQDDAGDTPFEQVECPEGLPEMRIGMKALGLNEQIEGELVDADKIPIGWYHNDWIVKFAGADGEPLEDVTMTEALTWMPEHGHGGGQTPTIAELGDAEFDVDGLNVTMGGGWEFTFEMSATNADGEAVTDTVTFNVCNSQPKPETD